MCAVYIINRCPTAALQNSVPAELWYGRRQNIKKIKLFGSLVYLHIPKKIRKGKLDGRSKKCLMLGYCPNRYRLWDLEENKLITGRDVVFDESKTIKSSLRNQDFYQDTDSEENKEKEEGTEKSYEETDNTTTELKKRKPHGR